MTKNKFLKLLVLVLLAAVIFFAFSKITKKSEPARENLEEELNANFPLPEQEENRLDVLILGIRGKDDPDGGLLTDSIMLFSFEKENKNSLLVSIPRDLFVDLPGMVRGKANEIYEKGLAKKGGKEFAKNTFSRVTGVRIDNVVIFNFEAFKEAVDAVGGIDVNLKKPFEEKDQWGYEFSLPKGKNHLDGETALYYARSRYSTNDFDRSKRQQEIILALKERALSLGILSNPLKVSSLVSVLSENIDTDFNIFDTGVLLNLAQTLNSYGGDLQTKNMTTENILLESISDGIYILMPQNNNWNLIRGFFDI